MSTTNIHYNIYNIIYIIKTKLRAKANQWTPATSAKGDIQKLNNYHHAAEGAEQKDVEYCVDFHFSFYEFAKSV